MIDEIEGMSNDSKIFVNLALENIGHIINLKTLKYLLIDKGIFTEEEYKVKFEKIKDSQTQEIAEEVQKRLLNMDQY